MVGFSRSLSTQASVSRSIMYYLLMTVWALLVPFLAISLQSSCFLSCFTVEGKYDVWRVSEVV